MVSFDPGDDQGGGDANTANSAMEHSAKSMTDSNPNSLLAPAGNAVAATQRVRTEFGGTPTPLCAVGPMLHTLRAADDGDASARGALFNGADVPHDGRAVTPKAPLANLDGVLVEDASSYHPDDSYPPQATEGDPRGQHQVPRTVAREGVLHGRSRSGRCGMRHGRRWRRQWPSSACLRYSISSRCTIHSAGNRFPARG